MRFGICRATGILEKSKRLRKALFFIVKKLPISRAAEARARIAGQTAECVGRGIRSRAAGNLPQSNRNHSRKLQPRNLNQAEKTMGRLRGQYLPQTPIRALCQS